jgi:MoaA/NifB/PqqE/SkfB family radical SAM enzyme
VISPREAAERFAYFRKRVGNLKVVGIAGPGDALANPDETLSTMELIRALDPEVTLCLATNGLALPRFLNDLVDVGVSHVTVTINTLNPATGACICRFVNHMGRILEGEEGAAILLENQLAGVSQLAKQGIACKVNTVALRGVNEDEIASIAADIRRRGAAIHNVMNMIPVAGSAFEDLAPLDDEELNALRDKAAIGIKQMRHCRRCRADAAGTLAHDESISSSWTLDQRRQRCEA